MRPLILFFTLLFIIGCGDNDDGGNPIVPEIINADCLNSNPGCEIIPLAVGNSWTWERIYYDTSGTELGRDTIYDQISRDSVINSETWYFMSPVWLTNRADGIWYLDISEGLWYKYPASVGDLFKVVPGSVGKEVISLDTVVANDLGLFSCYEYKTIYDWGDSSFACVAPGIGRIWSSSYYQKDDTSTYLGLTTELIQYTLE